MERKKNMKRHTTAATPFILSCVFVAIINKRLRHTPTTTVLKYRSNEKKKYGEI